MRLVVVRNELAETHVTAQVSWTSSVRSQGVFSTSHHLSFLYFHDRRQPIDHLCIFFRRTAQQRGLSRLTRSEEGTAVSSLIFATFSDDFGASLPSCSWFYSLIRGFTQNSPLDSP